MLHTHRVFTSINEEFRWYQNKLVSITNDPQPWQVENLSLSSYKTRDLDFPFFFVPLYDIWKASVLSFLKFFYGKSFHRKERLWHTLLKHDRTSRKTMLMINLFKIWKIENTFLYFYFFIFLLFYFFFSFRWVVMKWDTGN